MTHPPIDHMLKQISPESGIGLVPMWRRCVIMVICLLLTVSQTEAATYLLPLPGRGEPDDPTGRPARIATPPPNDSTAYLDAELLVPVGQAVAEEGDSILTVVTSADYPYGLDGKKEFNPDPTRAVWMSALFPGLGQVYNRRYWKLPIVVGGFMGLGYATSWNNRMLNDYTRAYRDLTDSDPATDSYMDFFPPTTTESDIDKTWLTSLMRSRRDYYRRNRDLCIICVVGLYLLCMVDAYVDASLSHFDISENLAMDVAPSLLINPGQRRPSLGLNWALTF